MKIRKNINKINKSRLEIVNLFKYFFNEEPDKQFVKYYIEANLNHSKYNYSEYISLMFLIKIKINPFMIEPFVRIMQKKNLLTFKLFLFMQLLEIFDLKIEKNKIFPIFLFIPLILILFYVVFLIN